MPRYHGLAWFLIEVLEFLLRLYIVWLFVIAIVLPAPFVIWAAFTVGFEDAIRPWLSLSVGLPLWWFAMAHWMTFLAFPYYARARFPYASPCMTFAIAGFAGVGLLGAVWTYFGDAWAGDRLLNPFQWAGLATICAAALGALMMTLGGTGQLHWGLSRWIGWLLVGREGFEAFLTADMERLKRDYEKFAKPSRK